MSQTDYEIEIDGTKFKWEHNGCRCSGHCGTDRFYKDGEFYGNSDNQALCDFITDLIVELKQYRKEA